MKLEFIKKGALEYGLITELYTPSELVKIKQELVKLRENATVNSTRPALDSVGRSLNFADSVWVDTLFEDRTQSSILTLNRKLFATDIAEQLGKHNEYFKHIRYCDCDATMVNYYTNDTEYKAHRDKSMLSAITFFSVGDFSGGELVFPEFGEVIKPIENTMVIFPGCVKHKANPVKTDGKYSYRVSMAQFIHYMR